MKIEDFEIFDKLGKGSFGCVYLVKKKDDKHQTNYALKVLEKDKVLAQNLIRYAKTERNVLSLAKHQFIVGLNYAF
jgi:serine/threonine protein kinase